MSRLRHALLIIPLVMLAAAGPVGCGGNDEPASAPTTTPATTTDSPDASTSTSTATPTPTKAGPASADLTGLDAADAALIAGYLGWTELTKPPIAELASLGSAHGGEKRVWASPTREALTSGGAQRFPYPQGSVVVKQGAQGDVVTLIALMEKNGDGGAATGGWRYVEYTRASADDPFTKVGLSQSGCAGCHQNADTRQSTDWVFWALDS